MAVLVIGATGILAPAVEALIGRGHGVLAVARDERRLNALRDRQPGSSVYVLAADAAEPGFPATLRSRLHAADLTASAGLVYGPATSGPVVETLTGIVDGPLVEILTSRVATPAAGRSEWSLDCLPPAMAAHARLVLGWKADAESTRWHDASEVSDAAVAALGDPHDRVLGELRPWNRRP